MSLKHTFSLVSKNEIKGVTFSELDKYVIEQIEIDDELILYIDDSLKWLTTSSPINNKIILGFDYYGISKLENSNIKKFKNIITAWKLLFENGGENIELRGSYFQEKDEEGYEKIEIKKRFLLSVLGQLIDLCEKALKEDMIILHFGI